MATFLVGYTIILALVFLIVFVMLVGNGVIFRNNMTIRRLFGQPLMVYSIRRVVSGIISVLLAVSATYMLIRLQDTLTLCKAAINNWDKLHAEIRQIRCNQILDELGLSGSVMQQLFTYYYRILPFPKTLCSTEMIVGLGSGGGLEINVISRNCRNFIIDLGKVYFLDSYVGQYVIDVIFKSKMPHSFKIGAISIVLELALGYPLGVYMAKHHDGWIDRIGKAYIISIDAIPGVAYYYIWMTIFCFGFGLPILYNEHNFASWLPAILTIAFTGMAGIALWVRRYMLNEFTADYVKFARSKGLSENRIMWVHILRNAIVPLVRSIPAAILGALLGSFYIEKIYSIPGLGGLLIQANNPPQDYFAIQGIVVISALISIVAYVSGDIVTAMVDPRISFSKE
ncbi:MAG: ABC transporter permease [Syntrophomonadaceae bacterium]|jgi:oligopeptide transport system permease protein